MYICDKAVCTSCGVCMNICPHNCILMEDNKEGFRTPVIDKERCVGCGLCVTHCPQNSSIALKRYKEPVVYAAYSVNEEQMIRSTSGGIFPLLAEQIIKMGGSVYGAKLDSDFKVRFTRIDVINDLIKLQGSKYVQSNVGMMYRHVRQDLEQGRKVLFSGVPCQVGGLYSFLGKDYTNLYTIDVVCRGVPSEKVLHEYISDCEKKEGSKLDSLTFRHKENKWRPMSFGTVMHLNFKNGNKYSRKSTKDAYYRTFLANIAMMESCYHCRFNGFPRVADITLGDFLGLGIIKKCELYNQNGISQVLLNSEKGNALYEKCADRIQDERRTINECCYFNLNLWLASKRNPNREAFFEEFDVNGGNAAVRKYVCSIKKEIIQKVKDCVIKMIGEKMTLLLMHKKRIFLGVYPVLWAKSQYIETDDI